MTPLPAGLDGRSELIVWRLDSERHAAGWDSGEGARLYGGRWNSVGRRVVYCSVDPACAILEVAVHKGFAALDTVKHVLTAARVHSTDSLRVIAPHEVPNENWLRPGIPGAGQQKFADALLAAHSFVLIPSAVSTHSWNLLFDPTVAQGRYSMASQEAFALDTRLHPPVTTREG